jgi:hypothetical protein
VLLEKESEMRHENQIPNVVDLAYQIIQLHQQVEYLKEENEGLREYRQKYSDLLNSSLDHSREMTANILIGILAKSEREVAREVK